MKISREKTVLVQSDLARALRVKADMAARARPYLVLLEGRMTTELAGVRLSSSGTGSNVWRAAINGATWRCGLPGMQRTVRAVSVRAVCVLTAGSDAVRAVCVLTAGSDAVRDTGG